MNRRVSRRLVALGLVAAVVVLGPGLATSSNADTDASGWTQTKTLTRDYFVNGQPTADTRTVTVRVDKHTDLQARERIEVSWTGAHPSGGRSASPYGENGLEQEYPVVILECRGVDDPSAPAADQVSPSTCWTSTWSQRTTIAPASSAVWLKDRYAVQPDLQDKVYGGADPADCPTSFAIHVTPMTSAGGHLYPGCSADKMPPEAAVGAADPPNEQEAFTGVDGTGSASFEVRTDTENATLGCRHGVECSLVVVPIMGISCSDASTLCNQTGAFPSGSSNFAKDGVQPAVSPLYWWSASNWRNRFSVPLTFALTPDTCDLLGSGPPVAFYGSELLSQAALQWAPAYCLRKDRFNWQSNTMPDEAAYALMNSGQSVAAEVSGKQPSSGPDPVGYAPTAVTGFGIAYDIDRPGNAGSYGTLRLNARLLAKLLTESYPASTMGQAHPGLDHNPLSLNLDPEFQKLNPGLDTEHFSEAASTLLSLSTSSDVIRQVTSYIDADPDARAFMAGTPDPWGTKVNPAYKGLKLPVTTWPLLDTWVPDTPGQACLKNNPAPYLPKVAAPVSSMRLIATAMLLSWPNVQTRCDTDLSSGLFKLGRIDPQNVGSRFMLGLVTLGDAARYGLDVAALQAAPDRYVTPDAAGLGAALRLARQPARYQPFVLDQKVVRRSGTAYPGTMVAFTVAKLRGLPHADAARVAQFIHVSSTEGQAPGRGNGQLPAGYLPIRPTGATAALYRSDTEVAAAVLAQKAPRPTRLPRDAAPGSGVTSSGSGSTAADAAGPGSTPDAAAPPSAATHGNPAPKTVATSVVARTTPLGSGLSNALLPFLLFVGMSTGLLAAVGHAVLRMRGAR